MAQFEVHTLHRDWSWDNFAIDGLEMDYCLEVLRIPQEYIEDVWLEEEAIIIELEYSEELHRRKWFHMLLKVANLVTEAA
jgi:hypothetical protein